MDYAKPEVLASYSVMSLYSDGKGFDSVFPSGPCDFGPGKDTGHLNDNPGQRCGPH